MNALLLFQQYVANARELVIVLEGANAETVEDAAHCIAVELRRRANLVAGVAWQPPWLEHPEQVAELLAYLWFNQPPDEFQRLMQKLAPDKAAVSLRIARQRLATSLSPDEMARFSYDPLGLTQLPGEAAGAAPAFAQGQSLFASTDGRLRIVYVEARSELGNYRECERWLAEIKSAISAGLAASRSPTGQVQLSYTGRPAFVAESAAGMRRDIMVSVNGTAAVIALLFWLAHRRVKPMLWLLALLALILGSTLALGALLYGSVNVLSMGFAAILLGLAVDYAVVHYQEALAHPQLSIPQVRRAIAPSILWAGITTVAAFLALNFSGLPGLAQLGTLVGLGIALAACVMILEYLPPLFPERRESSRAAAAGVPPALERKVLPHGSKIVIAEEPSPPGRMPGSTAGKALVPLRALFALVLTGGLVASGVLVLAFGGMPRVDATGDALRPRNSSAYDALERLQNKVGQAQHPLWIIASGTSPGEVACCLGDVEALLNRAVSNHVIRGFTLSTPLWPRPQFQSANRSSARMLSGRRESLRAIAATNGFAPRSLALAEGMLATWHDAAASETLYWPTNPLSQWVLNKAVSRSKSNYLAMGLLQGGTNSAGLALLAGELSRRRVLLAGWQLLGQEVLARVQNNVWRVIWPMSLLVFLSLCLAFRRATEVLLGLGVLALSCVCLLAIMRLMGWSWNLLNLMAVPLILGTGVDYSLFTLLALRRHHGDLAVVHRSVGRALLLCGGTAVAAFASLAWSSNAGMASLGALCAVGIAGNMLIAVFLLPIWWRATAASKK